MQGGGRVVPGFEQDVTLLADERHNRNLVRGVEQRNSELVHRYLMAEVGRRNFTAPFY